jgi:PKHD-type hydroxylase
MILTLPNVLTPEELAEMRAIFARAVFEPGAATAGWGAKEAKHNLQMKQDTAEARRAQEIVTRAVVRSGDFAAAVRPKAMRPALFNRYEAGMTYGNHVDDALMGFPQPLRTDVSFTLFISDPAEYDGGELVVVGTHEERAFKLAAGSIFLYPASTLHRVDPVTRGVRQAAVSWVQSFIRDPMQREILYDLELVRRSMFQRSGKTAELDRLSKCHVNLIRLWTEV